MLVWTLSYSNAVGLRTRAGKPLAPQRFADLLCNPVYVGKLQAWGISSAWGWAWPRP